MKERRLINDNYSFPPTTIKIPVFLGRSFPYLWKTDLLRARVPPFQIQRLF